MSEPGSTGDSGPSNSITIQTVGQLKEWLKEFPDHSSVLGAIHGQPLVSHVQCRHAEGHVIIEVPRLKSGS
jgi:hypothetical protein